MPPRHAVVSVEFKLELVLMARALRLAFISRHDLRQEQAWRLQQPDERHAWLRASMLSPASRASKPHQGHVY